MLKGEQIVGYKRPPKHSRFKTGQSGNPNGRPKRRGTRELDLDLTLTQMVAVQTPKGSKKLDSREIELRQQLEKAVVGDLKAAKYVLEIFEKYEAIAPPNSKIQSGVLVCKEVSKNSDTSKSTDRQAL